MRASNSAGVAILPEGGHSRYTKKKLPTGQAITPPRVTPPLLHFVSPLYNPNEFPKGVTKGVKPIEIVSPLFVDTGCLIWSRR